MNEKNTTEVREPLVRIVANSQQAGKTPFWKVCLVRVAAVVVALIIDALFIYSVTGLNPITVYTVMLQGTFMSGYNFMTSMRDMALLLCISIALAPAFKMRFWNIGAEGQVLVGGLATALVMIYLGDVLPTWLLFATMFTTSLAAGAVWALVPAYFKAKYKTNETLFTLMMNYVAINIVDCLTNIWRGSKSSMGTINVNSQAGWFPKILGYRFTLNIAIVLVLTIAMYIYLRYTKDGYEISVIGESENTARYAGINVKKAIIRTLAISGAICGLAGCITVAGKNQTISINTAGGYGFTAIIVAWLSKFNTFYMTLMAFILIVLEKGAIQIASSYTLLNDYAAEIITGIILFCILGSEFFLNYRIVFRSKAGKAGDQQ